MRVYTVDQAASIFQVSTKTIRKLIKSEKIAAFRIGNSIRIPESAMQGLMQDS